MEISYFSILHHCDIASIFFSEPSLSNFSIFIIVHNVGIFFFIIICFFIDKKIGKKYIYIYIHVSE